MSPDGVHDDDFPKNVCLKVNNKVSINNHKKVINKKYFSGFFILSTLVDFSFPLEAEFLNFNSSLGQYSSGLQPLGFVLG